jgi:hypothetical protein
MMNVNRLKQLPPILTQRMKVPSFSNHARAAVFCLALSGAASLYAAPTEDAVQPIQPSAGIETVNLAELTTPDVIRLAYYILLPGNHNYNSHRAYAMTEISEAAHSFGLDLKERGKGKEDQKKSDGRLVLARRLLEPLRTRLTSEEEKPALDHVEQALKEIVLALKHRGLDEEAQPLKQPESVQ